MVAYPIFFISRFLWQQVSVINGTYHDILTADFLRQAAHWHKNVSDHPTAFQVEDSGGPILISNLHSL